MATYDSTPDTLAHIEQVRICIDLFCRLLEQRAYMHDVSKLREPERALFDAYTPALRSTTYGSAEYQVMLDKLRPALDNHYAHNSHHPQHYPNGINGMSLLDIVEMFCDWKAATQRHDDGDFTESLRINRKRFGVSDQLADIFENTRRELGW